MDFKKNITKIFKNDFFILVLIYLAGLLLIILENNIIIPTSVLNIDEYLWISRSYNYLDSIKNLDFAGGIQSSHPGITIMTLSGISLWLADYLNGLHLCESCFINSSLAFNIPIVIIITLFFFSFYYLLRKLRFNKITAFFVMMICSMRIHYLLESTPTDKLVTVFILLSLSLLLIYANNKFKFKRYLCLSATFAGLGILTKLSALILIPFSFLILIFFSPLNNQRYKGILKDFAFYLGVVFMTITIIFPGIIIKPQETIAAMANVLSGILISGPAGGIEGLAIYSKKITFYLGSFGSGIIPPITVGLILYFLIFMAGKFFYQGIKSNFSDENLFRKNILILFCFGFVYFFYIAVFAWLLFYRYLIPLFLILDLVAAIALYQIMLRYRNRYQPKENIGATAIKIAVIFYFLQLAHLAFVKGYLIVWQ